MIVIRRRLIIWIIKAYIRKWGKTILISFAVGFLCFFLLYKSFGTLVSKVPFNKKEIVGVVGAYTLETIPDHILQLLSSGLTKIDKNGTAQPYIATSWQISDSGKKYVFFLNPATQFSNGTKITAKDIQYNFADTKIERPNDKTIVFLLKDTYAPFLVTVSRPIFKPGNIGIGEYKIQNIKLNGDFIQSLTLTSTKNAQSTRVYQFYGSNEALKTAYMLGDVSQATGLLDTKYKEYDMSTFPNTTVKKTTNYQKLVTIFYNNQDKVLSDKKVRDALSLSLPDTFAEGERNYSPYAATSWAYQDYTDDRKEDITHAKLLLQASSISSSSAQPLEIKVQPKYESVAKKIVESWKRINIPATIETVSTLPTDFQIFVGDFNVPKDPDQYTLWHSSQQNNITNYKNLRIDKLLEDGRKTVDMDERKKIYADFQKYLLDDSPASFLFFPYQHDVIRK